MLTYNQEEFITQTIESVLGQKTNFNFQLVIGEDCSTDKTTEICRSYAKEFPSKIKLLESEKNQGLIRNFIRTYKECDGKYVAILDGDDYWVDPLKLQKQVDFLNENSECSIVFTGFKKLFLDGRLVSKDYSKMQATTGFEDLIKGNYICSATVLFRNKSHINDYPQWISQFPYGDWPLYLWATRNDEKIGFLNIETAVYRMEIGVSEKLKKVHSDILKVNFRILKCAFKDNNFESNKNFIEQSLVKHRFALMATYYRENKLKKFGAYALKLFPFYPFKVIHLYLYLLKRNLNLLK